jgi:hypothetical protein
MKREVNSREESLWKRAKKKRNRQMLTMRSHLKSLISKCCHLLSASSLQYRTQCTTRWVPKPTTTSLPSSPTKKTPSSTTCYQSLIWERRRTTAAITKVARTIPRPRQQPSQWALSEQVCTTATDTMRVAVEMRSK